jgi:hypothetical protein
MTKPVHLVTLASLARQLGVHRDTLARRLRAMSKTMRRPILFQDGPDSTRFVDLGYLSRLNGRGGKSVEDRLAKLEAQVAELRERVDGGG